MTRWLGLLVGLAALTAGCGRKHRSPDACPLFRATYAEDDRHPAVAWVNGHPIPRAALAERIQATGETPRQALAELVECKLLELEALRLGLDQDPEVQRAARAAAARKLLKTVFEPSFRPEDVPEHLLRKSYQLNIRHFVRPELRRFSHVLVRIPWHRRRRKIIVYRDEARAAKALAEEFHEMVLAENARHPLTWKEFEALADRIRDRGFEVRVEHGLKARRDLIEPFAGVLFSLPRPGAISKVVKTKYGFHVIYLIEIQSPVNIPFEQARRKVLEHVYPELREERFRAWMEKLEAQCPIETHPERIPISGACSPERVHAF